MCLALTDQASDLAAPHGVLRGGEGHRKRGGQREAGPMRVVPDGCLIQLKLAQVLGGADDEIKMDARGEEAAALGL